MSNLVITTLSSLASIKKTRAGFQRGIKQETFYLNCLIWIFCSVGAKIIEAKGRVEMGDGGGEMWMRKGKEGEKERKNVSCLISS